MTFEEIYTAYWQKIYRLCMGYVNDREVAQDLAQETFMIVWQKLPQFRNEADVGTWIFRIASNNCLRHVEKDRRITKTALPLHLAEEKMPSLEPQIQLLYKLISELPETDRIIVSLELEEVRQAEIAGIVGLSESNVRVRLHRIKEKLTLKFREHGQ